MKASIDIGTNTVLLLVAKLDGDHLDILCEEERTPRLGEGVDKSKKLSDAAMQRVIDVLLEYQQMISEEYAAVTDITVTATSAVRDAQNRAQFLNEIYTQTGWNVQVLSGAEEAQYTYSGAKSVLDDELLHSSNVVIDIGGGSTEIAVGTGNRITDYHSFDMGCVRFTERYLRDDPLSETQITTCKKAVRAMLSKYDLAVEDSTLVGVAGTVTSLGYIDLGLQEYQPDQLNGYTISVDTLREYISDFRLMTAKDIRKKYPTVMNKRADIFRAGLLILEGFMDRYQFDQVLVSTGGIRHGAILINVSD